MKKREKIQKELNRRLDEIKWFEDRKLISQELAQNFFARIADYVNYTKKDLLEKFCTELQNQVKGLDIDQELLTEGNIIIGELEKDLKYIKQAMARKKVEILPFEKSFPAGGGMLSGQQSLSLSIHDLSGFVKNENKYVGDVPGKVAELWSILGRLNEMGIKLKKSDEINKKYQSLVPSLNEKLRLQKTWISFLRVEDYEKLLDVWKLYFNKYQWHEFSLLRMQIGTLLSDDVRMPSLSQDNIRILEELREEYLLYVSRFHNYLTDRLEEKDWIEDANYWLWEHFGPTLISLLLIIAVLAILNYLKIKAPLDILISLLKP